MLKETFRSKDGPISSLLTDAKGSDLGPFLRNVDDLVMIHTYNRPDLIGEQILAFIANREGFMRGAYEPMPGFSADSPQLSLNKRRKILFAVIEDSDPTYTDIYKELLHNLASSLPPEMTDRYGIVYVDKLEQNALVDEAPPELKQTITAMTHDTVSGKFGGIRGVQNISEIVAAFFSGLPMSYGKNPIIHKLDDDIFPGTIVVDDSRNMKIGNSYDIFAHKAQLLRNRQLKRYLGSHYDGGSPSPIFTLQEAVSFLHHILTDGTLRTNPNETNTWRESLDRLPLTTPKVTGVEFAQLPPWYERSIQEQLLTPGLPGQSTSFTKFLAASLPVHLGLIQSGINYISPDSTTDAQNADWFGPIGVVAGGFNSYRADTRIPPSPPFGNQDILRAPLHQAQGGEVYADQGVLHLKGARPPLFADLSSKNLTNPRHTFLLSACVIQALEDYLQASGASLRNGLPSHRTVVDECFRFGGDGNRFIQTIVNQVNFLSEYLHTNPHVFGTDTAEQRTIEGVKIFIDTIKAHLPELIYEFSVDDAPGDLKKTAKELLFWWMGHNDTWQKALAYYRGLGEKLARRKPSYSSATTQGDTPIHDLLHQKGTPFTPPSAIRGRSIMRERTDDVSFDGLTRIQDVLAQIDNHFFVSRELSADRLATKTAGEVIYETFLQYCKDWKYMGGQVIQIDDQPERRVLTFGSNGYDYRYNTLETHSEVPPEDLYFLRVGVQRKETTPTQQNDASLPIEETLQNYIDTRTLEQDCYFSLYQVPSVGPWCGMVGDRPHVSSKDLNVSEQEYLITQTFFDPEFFTVTPLHIGGVFIQRKDKKSIFNESGSEIVGFILNLNSQASSKTLHGHVLPVLRFE